MKIEIVTNEKSIVKANYILSFAIESLKKNSEARRHYEITEKDIAAVEKFQKKLLNGFFKQASKK